MLQPNQPMGLPQQPKPMGAPQGMAPQGMPAQAAQASALKPGGITTSISDIKDAYADQPQKLQQAAQTDFLSAIAWQQLVTEQESKARDLKLKQAQQTGQQQPTVVEQRQQQALELRKQDMEQQQAERLQTEQRRGQQGIQQLTQQMSRGAPPMGAGIGGLPAPNAAEPRAMAAGGIVAFEEGGDVNPPTNRVDEAKSTEVDEMLRRNPGMTLQQAQDILSGRQTTRPEEAGDWRKKITSGINRGLSISRPEAEARSREEGMRYFGYTPEEKASQEKRIGEMEAYDKAAYNPERLQNEGLAAFLLGAGNRGSIGSVMQGAGVSGLNYSNKMRELARQRMEDRQKKSEDWMESQRGVRAKAFDFGQREGQTAQKEYETALREGVNLTEAEKRLAAALGRGSAGSGNKALEDASQAVARDTVIADLKGKLKDTMSGTPEYNDIVNQIESRAKSIYSAFKAPYPEMPAPQETPEAPKEEGTLKKLVGGLGNLINRVGSGAQQLQQSSAPASPLPQSRDQLVAGKVYNTARGPATWDGQQFVK